MWTCCYSILCCYQLVLLTVANNGIHFGFPDLLSWNTVNSVVTSFPALPSNFWGKRNSAFMWRQWMPIEHFQFKVMKTLTVAKWLKCFKFAVNAWCEKCFSKTDSRFFWSRKCSTSSKLFTFFYCYMSEKLVRSHEPNPKSHSFTIIHFSTWLFFGAVFLQLWSPQGRYLPQCSNVLRHIYKSIRQKKDTFLFGPWASWDTWRAKKLSVFHSKL